MKQMNQAPVADRKGPIRKQNAKLTGVQKIGIGLILLIILGAVISGIGYLVVGYVYQRELPTANAGVQHLENAQADLLRFQKNITDTQSATQAQQEFVAAQQNFTQVDGDLHSIPGIASNLPGYGSQIQASLHLVPLALEISRSGVTGSKLLNILLERFHSNYAGMTQAELTAIGQDLQTLRSQLGVVMNDVNQLQPADLQADARVTKMVSVVHNNVPGLQKWLERVNELLPVAPALLGIGTPANYLIEILDPTELQPGGGTIVNYNLATMKNSILSNAATEKSSALDSASKAVIPLPAAYQWFSQARAKWSFSDSNLDANFSTNAQNAEANYLKAGGQVPLQGVIAITSGLIQRALVITGPIEVPEYKETVSTDNFAARIIFHQKAASVAAAKAAALGQRAPAPDTFSSLLIDHLFARLLVTVPSNVSQTARIFTDAVHSKDVQLYLNNPVAERVLHNSQLDAALQTFPHDGLFVVDANVGANKANAFVTSTLTDNVTIDANGNATHHATLHYIWTGTEKLAGQDVYRDYVQVYVPSGSELLTQQGWQAHGSSTTPGLKMWSGSFTLNYGKTNTVMLSWRVQQAAIHTSQDWQYENLLQRQAGSLWQVTQQVALPSCATIKATSGGMISQGKQNAILDRSLVENVQSKITYSC